MRQGGSYEHDPKTGKTRLRERTRPKPEQAAEEGGSKAGKKRTRTE